MTKPFLPDPRMPSTIDHYVGARIREMREQCGLTQDALGALIGVRFQQVQKYESGANRISAGRLYQIAQAMNVPVESFFPARKAHRRAA